MRDRFTIRHVTEELDYERADADTVSDTGPEPADLAAVLDAFDEQCWDLIDERSDGTTILYPADCDTDYRTGAVTRTQVILTADQPENMSRAANLHRARTVARSTNPAELNRAARELRASGWHRLAAELEERARNEERRPRLEGPFTYASGWRGYYDPAAGLYLGLDDIYLPPDFDPNASRAYIGRQWPESSQPGFAV